MNERPIWIRLQVCSPLSFFNLYEIILIWFLSSTINKNKYSIWYILCAKYISFFVFSKYRAININQIIRIMLVHTVNTCQNERARVLELDSFQIASIVFYMNTLDNSSIKNRKQLRKAQERRMAWISLWYNIPKWNWISVCFGWKCENDIIL